MSSAIPTFNVQVADVRAEARDVMTVELRAVGGGALPPFEPGAHLDLHLPNGLVRQYSLTNDWRERDRYVIGVGRAADSRGGSSFVHSSVRAGMQLTISAPRNNFALDERADRFLFIAGGIGITPIMAMVRWCAVTGKPWRLIYAARSRQRAAFYEELCALAQSSAQFHFDDESGQVLDVAQTVASWSEGEWIYCCGPTPLMESVKKLTEHLPAGTVRFEWFTAPENDEPQDSNAFKIRLDRSGVEFDVPAQKSILEVLEEHGFELPFSCREGLCGTCVTNVCSGEPDHRDYVLSDEERASGKMMTICCSRSKSPVLTLDL
ncbi:MAG TPA: PDR/VanB family oxidoreductase [Sphingomicrobium sp.]|nr:PDR/VanB family oxidoreductase [Sphingomicrobium sp.]